MVGVAVLGFGVVGSGVVEVIEENREVLCRRTGETFVVKHILDIRDFPQSPFAGLFVKDFSIIEKDPSVSVVVEAIGGRGAAFELTKRALRAGKHVVTPNKELVSACGVELFQLAKENNVEYLYEASVGGGIPIIRPLQQCLAANDVNEIHGILNGTTNYILTQMELTGTSFSDALMQAQTLGYAEQNPDADISGKDTCRKLAILTSLALGMQVSPEEIETEGISAVSAEDIAHAAALNRKIKLLGRAVKAKNGIYHLGVAPCLVAEDAPLAGVSDVFNAIIIRGSASGELMFRGRGAGKLPTASAVVADVIDVSRQHEPRPWMTWGKRPSSVPVAHIKDLPHAYLLRFQTADKMQFMAKAASVFTEVQPANTTPAGKDVAFVTNPLTRRALAEKIAALGASPLSAYVFV